MPGLQRTELSLVKHKTLEDLSCPAVKEGGRMEGFRWKGRLGDIAVVQASGRTAQLWGALEGKKRNWQIWGTSWVVFVTSRRGLTPRGSLECNPEIPAFPGEEN